MRLPVYNLRTAVLVQLVFLILAAMFLMNMIMVVFYERDLVKAKARAGRLCIEALEPMVGQRLQDHAQLDPETMEKIKKVLATEGFERMLVVDSNGNPVFSGESQDALFSYALTQSREALLRQTWLMDFWGSTWGVIWLSDESLQIAGPLYWRQNVVGAMSINASLIPVYQAIRQSEWVFLFFILLYALILSMVGYLLLSRLVVNPVDRLLKMTNAYTAGDTILPLPEMEAPNEIGQLTSSLNHMLKRLDENKRELQAYIYSLEKANRELERAQADLIRSEKLASVGRLAAGVAHEIGNPIGIVLGYLELLGNADISENEKKDFLPRMENEVMRINRTIRQLLDFSRPASGLKQEVDVHEILHSTVEMLSPQPMLAGVQVDFRLTARHVPVLADPNQLQQVFLNIIINAADALEQQRQIYLKSLEGENTFEKQFTITSGNQGNQIVLEFSDNGPGVAEEHLTHIFDPFYTTKDPGKGTGLGLAVCHQIISELGGKIWAEHNQAGEGVSIFIALPLSHSNKEKGNEAL